MQTGRLQIAVLGRATPPASHYSDLGRFKRVQDPDKTPPLKPRPWDGRRREAASASRTKPLENWRLSSCQKWPGLGARSRSQVGLCSGGPRLWLPGREEEGGGRRPGFRSSRFTKEGGKEGGAGDRKRSGIRALRK